MCHVSDSFAKPLTKSDIYNLSKNFGHTILPQQTLLLFQNSGTVTDPGVDQTLDRTLLPSSFPDYASVEPFRQISHASLEGVLKLFAGREEPLDGAEDDRHVLLERVDDGVGSRVKCVGGDYLAGGTVELFDNGDDSSRDVVEVEDGRGGVETDGVERVAVGHGELGKFGKVSSLDSLRDRIHPLGDDPKTLLQEGRCLYSLLHAGSG